MGEGNLSLFVCSNCGKKLLNGEKQIMEKADERECSECRFHAVNDTRTIEKYNDWLRGK